MMPRPPVPPFDDLAAAARATMEYLQRELGLAQWIFARVEDDDWIVLDTLGERFPIERGTVASWSDSMCSRLVAGEGSLGAPHAAAPFAKGFASDMYVGMPIFRRDGSLFGTLCGIGAEAATAIKVDPPLVERMSRFLGSAVDRQREADDAERRADALAAEAFSGGATGILHRKAWELLVSREDARCRRYGTPACLFVVCLDALDDSGRSRSLFSGGSFVEYVAAMLRATFRPHDIVARTGSDVFSVLATECDGVQGELLLARLKAKFARASISASAEFAYRPAARLADSGRNDGLPRSA